MKESVGKIVSDLRRKFGYTQLELAQLVYCSRQYVSHVENGVRPLSNKYVVPMSVALKFNFAQFIRQADKFETIEHYLITQEMIDYIGEAEYERLQKLLKKKTVVKEFTYGTPLLIKEYCEALVLTYIDKEYRAAEKSLLKTLGLKNRYELTQLVIDFQDEERYYSCLALLACVLCLQGNHELALMVVQKKIVFLEKFFFNNTVPPSAIEPYFRKLYIITLNNYADIAFNQENYQEALETCNKTKKVIVDSELAFALEVVMKLKVEALYKLDLIEEANKLYNEFKVVCKLKNSYDYFYNVNAYFSEEYELLETCELFD